jgi:CheY-like chemotaxis protein
MKTLKKILIVEDDAFLQDFYRIIFKKIGAEIILAENADEILRIVADDEVELIIMDINLRNTSLNNQRIDGIKLSRHIKEHYASMHIPIILITAYPLSSFGNHLLEDSMADDYLIKPIADFNQLIEKINNLVYINT